jgi:hypothetical protein
MTTGRRGATKWFIAYLRVIRDKQGRSGLWPARAAGLRPAHPEVAPVRFVTKPTDTSRETTHRRFGPLACRAERVAAFGPSAVGRMRPGWALS